MSKLIKLAEVNYLGLLAETYSTALKTQTDNTIITSFFIVEVYYQNEKIYQKTIGISDEALNDIRVNPYEELAKMTIRELRKR